MRLARAVSTRGGREQPPLNQVDRRKCLPAVALRPRATSHLRVPRLAQAGPRTYTYHIRSQRASEEERQRDLRESLISRKPSASTPFAGPQPPPATARFTLCLSIELRLATTTSPRATSREVFTNERGVSLVLASPATHGQAEASPRVAVAG